MCLVANIKSCNQTKLSFLRHKTYTVFFFYSKMSDNIRADVVQKQLNAQLRIPNEVWTDILKMLSRRTLVQQISPVCFRFKEICNKNIKSVHEIKEACRFNGKLMKNDREANKQLEHLASNTCALAGQFRLIRSCISHKNKAILRHCPDLFEGCVISAHFGKKNKKSTLFLEGLTILGAAKPKAILIDQHIDPVCNYWRHPTVQNCTRIVIGLTSDYVNVMATCLEISEWLHRPPPPPQMPVDMDSDNTALDGQLEEEGGDIRCLIFIYDCEEVESIVWLLNRCVQRFKQSQELTDRRKFVLSFVDCPSNELETQFGFARRIENPSTQEVLLLERVMDNGGQPTHNSRLRRCLATEEDDGKEFYGKTFKPHGDDDASIDEFSIAKGTVGVAYP